MAAPFQASWMKTPVERVAEQAAMQAPTTIPNQPGGQKFDPFVPNAGTWEEFQQPGQIQEQPNNPNINKGRPSKTDAFGPQFDNFFKWGEEKTGKDNFIESPYKNSTMASNPETIEEKAQQNKDTVKESSPWPSQQRPLEAIQKQSKEEKIDKPATLAPERPPAFVASILGHPAGIGEDADKPLPQGQIARKDTQGSAMEFIYGENTPQSAGEVLARWPEMFTRGPALAAKKGLQDVTAGAARLAGLRSESAKDGAKYGMQIGDKFIGKDDIDKATVSVESWTLPNGVQISDNELRNEAKRSTDGTTLNIPSYGAVPYSWLDQTTGNPYYTLEDGTKLSEADITYKEKGGNAEWVQDPDTYGPLGMGKTELGDLWKGEDIIPNMADALLSSAPYMIPGPPGDALRATMLLANLDAAMSNVNPRDIDWKTYGYPDQEIKNSQKLGNAVSAIAEPLTEKIGGIAGTKSKHLPWKEAKTVPGRIGQDFVQEAGEEALMVPVDQLAQDGFINYGSTREWNPVTNQYEYKATTPEERLENLASNAANSMAAGGILGGGFSSVNEAGKAIKGYQDRSKGKTYNNPELPYDNANLQAEKDKLLNKKISTLTKEGGE